MVKNLIKDILVEWVAKSLPSLHLILWLLRDMCCADKRSLSQSVTQFLGATQVSTTKFYQQC